MRSIETQLNEMGFQLIAIAPDRPAKLRETKEKYGIQGIFLSDSRMAAAQAFRVAYQVDANTLKQLEVYGIDLEEASGENHHQLPVPAVFIAGTDGVIQFTYANPDYTVRIRPEMLLAVAGTVRK
ncbi:MAG: redoxin domain-containing protein [Acidobacteria bacterium]|nr:MAG: redoxin domain-containing protein [Acidobacteriota bacterium]